MRLYILLPLALAAASTLWIWLRNRHPRIQGAVLPGGLVLAGEAGHPVLEYDGDVVLGGEQRFEEIRCRSLLVSDDAVVHAATVEAARVRVDGRLAGVRALRATRALAVEGELSAEGVSAPRVTIGRRARAMVLTVSGVTRLVRHPSADVRGFFASFDEAVALWGAGGARAGIPGADESAPERVSRAGAGTSR